MTQTKGAHGKPEQVPPKPPKKRHRVRNTLIGLLAVVILACVGVCAYWVQGLPGVQDVEEYTYNQRTTVYASDNHTVLAEFYLQDRQPVELQKISKNVIDATLATEDERFYSHGGIDLFGIARAVINNFVGGGGLQGASTVTQQFARNTLLADEATDMTVKRKIREAKLALDLEGAYSKDEILNMYLNTINYGDNCYGIEAAAQHYFNKSASQLSVLEAATLVGIPQSPSAYTPTVYPEACKERRNVVLQRMVDTGKLSTTDYNSLSQQPVTLSLGPTRPSDGIYLYPYFTSYVRDQLLSEYSAETVFKGGMSIYTTLDINDQKAAEEACNSQYEYLYNDDIEISLVSIDPSNGYIRAMVGGKDFYADQFNLATQAKRQAGSSFKAFTLAAAIELGINPNTVINCTTPATIGTWKVENINNTDYGWRSIQSATAVSSNTGFARIVHAIGSSAVVDVAHRMGIESELDDVEAITLGVSGVTPLEMASAYGTFATSGVHHKSTAITRVVDRDGKEIFTANTAGEQAISPEVAAAATNVLKTVFTQGTATAAQMYTGQPAAGKTGTSENYRDHWLCGFTPQLSTAVWIGSREEQSLPSIDCCNTWRNYMDTALASAEWTDFPTADAPTYTTEYNTALNSSGTSSYGYYDSNGYWISTGSGSGYSTYGYYDSNGYWISNSGSTSATATNDDDDSAASANTTPAPATRSTAAATPATPATSSAAATTTKSKN